MTVEVDRADAAPPLRAGSFVTVAWVGTNLAKLAAVRAGLVPTHADAPLDDPVWRVLDANTISAAVPVQLVVCTQAAMTSVCVQRWPRAAVLTLVADRDDDRATLAALAAGAAGCVRGDDPTLIVAFLLAMGRRHLAGEPVP
jgi:hypothetical protein